MFINSHVSNQLYLELLEQLKLEYLKCPNQLTAIKIYYIYIYMCYAISYFLFFIYFLKSIFWSSSSNEVEVQNEEHQSHQTQDYGVGCS
jgi:hypothetical protein